eukprot:Skav216616  [mRNA]  locus=scaffold2940:181187:182459:+ [translate_table: standard]
MQNPPSSGGAIPLQDSASTVPFETTIHTPRSDDALPLTRPFGTVENEEHAYHSEAAVSQAEKKHVGAFNFAFNFWGSAEYFAVRGEKRCGLITGPGATSWRNASARL